MIYPKKIITSYKTVNEKVLFLRRDLQIDLTETNLAEFESGSYIILDFGKEMRGGIRILCRESDLAPIHIRFGESIGECCADLSDTEKNATNDHALRDIEISLPNWSDTPIGDTGFRFVRLDFNGNCKIKSIVCNNIILSKRAIFTYRGDPEIEKIFKTAKRTVDLCASSGYIWDGIKRDRLMWTGDLAPQVLALTTLYGRTKEVERSIDFARTQAPLPNWMNTFPTYSMWWIIMLKDYYELTGAKEFTEKQMDYLEGLVSLISQGVSSDGTLNYRGYFVDWPRRGSSDEKDGARAINIMATNSAIFLLDKFDRNTDVAKAHLLRLLKQEIRPTSKAVTALKYLALGKLSESEQKILLTGGTQGMSTFMACYILKAVSAFDRGLAISMLKEYYGGMLSLGATTFWEEFEPEQSEGTPIDKLPTPGVPDCHGDFGKHCYVGFRRSLCHGWSAGIIANIKEFC